MGNFNGKNIIQIKQLQVGATQNVRQSQPQGLRHGRWNGMSPAGMGRSKGDLGSCVSMHTKKEKRWTVWRTHIFSYIYIYTYKYMRYRY